MHTSKVLAIVATLLAVALAGCTEANPENQAPAVDPCVVETPGDFEACADEPIPVDGSVQHVHDYWGGRDRITVMDSVEDVLTAVVVGGSWVRFDPLPGHVVPQGTSEVEITFSLDASPGNLYQNPELWVQTANESSSTFIAPIASGETIVVPSTNPQNDLPHQQLSAWQFWVRLDGQVDNVMTRYEGDVGIKVEAIRGLDIPAYPGHPDRWNGTEAIDLFSDSRFIGAYHYSHQLGGNVCMQCPVHHGIDDGIVVPHDAAYVEVRMAVTPPDAATGLDLTYHGADAREFTRVEPFDINGGVKLYHIEVGAAGDGPYAQQSLWEFRTMPGGLVDDALTGPTFYSLTATVHRNP